MIPELNFLQKRVRVVAQQILVPRFADVQRRVKLDGSVVTDVDHAMQNRLQAELAEHWPQYAFLGEETPASERAGLVNGTDKGMWCVDPLDGTTNYAAGVPFFSVSLALLIQGRPLLGVVYDPVRDECFTAQKGRGAWLNDKALGTRSLTPLSLERSVAAVDFKRLSAPLAVRLATQHPYGSQRNFGACSLEWCWLAAGRFHVYLHGGQKPWDYAAGCLILSEAGGRALTLEGEDIFAAGLTTRSVAAALDPVLFAAWRESLDRLQSSGANA